MTPLSQCSLTKLLDDNAEIQCICNANDAGTLLPACDACVQQYDTDLDDDNDDDNNNDNDVREVLNRCNFTAQSSFNTASTAPAPSGASPTAAATSSVSATRSGGNAATSAATNVASSTSSPSQVSQVSQNAAPAMTAAAGMGFGVLGLALGLL